MRFITYRKGNRREGNRDKETGTTGKPGNLDRFI